MPAWRKVDWTRSAGAGAEGARVGTRTWRLSGMAHLVPGVHKRDGVCVAVWWRKRVSCVVEAGRCAPGFLQAASDGLNSGCGRAGGFASPLAARWHGVM